jgi:hypothetical protein
MPTSRPNISVPLLPALMRPCQLRPPHESHKESHISPFVYRKCLTRL